MKDTSKPIPLPTVREQTLVRHASHVLSVEAHWVAKKFPRFVSDHGLLSIEDLMSIGREGLYDSARRFREEFSHDFTDFARRRVRGAMLDALTGLVREERIRRAAIVAADTFGAFFRDNTYNVMEHGYPEEATRRYEAFADSVLTATFAGAIEAADRSSGEAGILEREEYALAIRALREALAALTEAERNLLSLVYGDLLDLKTASTQTGLSYITTRRHHDSALRKLRSGLLAHGIQRAPPRLGAVDLGLAAGLARSAPQNDQRSGPKR